MTDLLKQSVFGLALGYEDLNDHEQQLAGPERGDRAGPGTCHSIFFVASKTIDEQQI